MEREHERDEFQQEIRRLEAQLRQTPSVDNKGYQVRHLTVCVCKYYSFSQPVIWSQSIS